MALRRYRQRMKTYPALAITELGFRSQSNFNISKGKVQHVFLGRNEDVLEEKRDFSRRARSATEGFIAVAKNLRGFGRSLYRGLAGDKIWTLLYQTAHHLKNLCNYIEKRKLKKRA